MKEWWGRRSRNQRVIIIVAVAIVAVAALIDSSNDNETVTSAGQEQVAQDDTESASSDSDGNASESDGFCVQARNSMRVDATCLDEVWPLTAEFGTLVCHPTQAVTFAGGGGVYAVNGQAMTIDGVEEIDPIWRDNPHVSGAKINIKPLIDLGLSLCS